MFDVKVGRVVVGLKSENEINNTKHLTDYSYTYIKRGRNYNLNTSSFRNNQETIIATTLVANFYKFDVPEISSLLRE